MSEQEESMTPTDVICALLAGLDILIAITTRHLPKAAEELDELAQLQERLVDVPIFDRPIAEQLYSIKSQIETMQRILSKVAARVLDDEEIAEIVEGRRS